MSKSDASNDFAGYKKVTYTNYVETLAEMMRSSTDSVLIDKEKSITNVDDLIIVPFKNQKILNSNMYQAISKICELNGAFVAGSFARACIYSGVIEDNFHEDALCVDGEYSSNQFLPESTYISVGNFTSKSKTEFPRYAKKYTRKNQQAIDTLQSKLMMINRLCPSDIDIYCQSEEMFDVIKNEICNYIENLRLPEEAYFVNEWFTDPPNQPEYPKKSMSKNYNIQLIHGKCHIEVFDIISTKSKVIFSPVVTKIQVINPEIAFGYRENVLSKFDLDVCKFSILDNENILATTSALENESKNRITINPDGVHSPIRTLYQIMKYARKGYVVGTFELMKLVCMIKKNVPDEKIDLINKFLDNYNECRINRSFKSNFYENELDELYAIFDFS